MKVLLVFSLILMTLMVKAQENIVKNDPYNRKSISLSYGFGNGQLVRSQALTGAAGNNGKTINTIALNMNRQISKTLFVDAGLSYLNHKYALTSVFYPGIPTVISTYSLDVLSIPIKLRYEFGKYFFLNGGLMADLDISKNVGQSKYSGIGIGSGVGFQYFLKNNLGVFVNPQLNYHSLISFSNDRYPQKLLDANVNLGLSYRFN